MLKNKEAYRKTVRRDYPPFYVSLIMNGYSSRKYHYVFTKQKYFINNLIIVNKVFFYSKYDIYKMSNLIFRQWQNYNLFQKHRHLLISLERKILNANKLNFLEFKEAYSAYMPALFYGWILEEKLIKIISSFLKQKLGVQKSQDLLRWITLPIKDNFYKQEECDLLKTKDIKKHVQKYIWLHSRYGQEKKYSLREALIKKKSINQEVFWKEYYFSKRMIKKSIQKAKNVLGHSQAHLIDLLQFIVYYRTQRTDVMNIGAYLAIPMLKRFARNLKITYQQLLFCTLSEISNQQIPSLDLIKERQNDFGMVLENKNITCFSGKKLKNLYNFFKLYPLQSQKLTFLKGFIAQSGIVKSKVKIINSYDDFNKLKKGEILVTSMTTPEMIPIMKKALAFITDEGGITCHAAIISRELKKPCIIGTKIATKVLKDGDFVEVDANHGVVKILNK